MSKVKTILKLFLLIMCLFTFSQVAVSQSKDDTPAIDLENLKKVIENRDKEFSKYIFEGDSVALANMYTKDAQFGTLKGAEIAPALGKWIRNAVKNDSRNVIFTTTSLTGDDEFLIEVGTAEIRDSQNNFKSKFKYLVVWKQEDGVWKLYRDIGL